MEKEEESTRELLLPNWQGSGSHGLTIAQRDDGVFVQEVMQNSPAARTGVVKEGDQIVGATIYFDNLQSGEVAQLLNTMGHHTVGLKLHRKGDRSPEPGQTWTHEVFSSHSSEVVLIKFEQGPGNISRPALCLWKGVRAGSRSGHLWTGSEMCFRGYCLSFCSNLPLDVVHLLKTAVE
nr:neuroblast differentiation-associated protein AHNAK isoform X1 [Vicugna pacos]